VLYHLYELNQAALSPARAAAEAYRILFRNPLNPAYHTPLGRSAAAALELFERTTRRYGRPAWRISETNVHGRTVAVKERVVIAKPFCNLVHFEREVSAWRRLRDPKLLIVAPMAGHFSTLLRGTVRDLLPYYDIYVTDWHDARFVPRSEGPFDLDAYIDYIIEFIRRRSSRPSLDDPDGGSDRRPGKPDRRQPLCREPHARMVRAECHHPGPVAIPGRDAACLSRFPPA